MNALSVLPAVAHRGRPLADISFSAVITAIVVLIAVLNLAVGGLIGWMGWRGRRDARRASGAERVGRS